MQIGWATKDSKFLNHVCFDYAYLFIYSIFMWTLNLYTMDLAMKWPYVCDVIIGNK